MLPTIKIGQTDVTRLIIGGNPFSGNSHVSAALDNEMMDYFTTETIKKTICDCLAHGVDTMQLRADRHIMRMVRELYLEGHKLNWIAQTASEIAPFETNVRNASVYKPAGVYLHGTLTDRLFKAKKYDEIETKLKIIRESGAAVGLGTHMPEVVEYAEERGLDLDFYMACVYNLSKEDRVSSAITGRANEGERYDDADKVKMYKTIRAAGKPCLAFKILAASRKCQSHDTIEAAFREAYANIKPIDGVVVGMFPKHSDQVRQNCDIVKKILNNNLVDSDDIHL